MKLRASFCSLLLALSAPLYAMTDVFNPEAVGYASIEKMMSLRVQILEDSCKRLECIGDQATAEREAPRLALQAMQYLALEERVAVRVRDNISLLEVYLVQHKLQGLEIDTLRQRSRQAKNQLLGHSSYGSHALELFHRVEFLLGNRVSPPDLMSCTGQLCLISLEQTFRFFQSTEDEEERENYLREYGMVAIALGNMLENLHSQFPEVTLDETLENQLDEGLEKLCRMCEQEHSEEE